MLDVDVHPRSLDGIDVVRFEPMEQHGSPFLGWARLLRAIKMVNHSFAQICRKPKVENLLQKRC
jgi:hypothetical protein